MTGFEGAYTTTSCQIRLVSALDARKALALSPCGAASADVFIKKAAGHGTQASTLAFRFGNAMPLQVARDRYPA